MSLRTPRKNGTSSSLSNGSSTPHDSVFESRKRQSKRDEAIRRRIENDLSKKRATAAKSHHKKKSKHGSAPGTVLSLRPSDPVICKPSYTAYEAAQLMSAKRENCILVVDEENEQLMGIFTAKDLAFRVVGKGLNASSVTIDHIMTENPLCATIDTPASEALNLMVKKGFRHLPIVDEKHGIVGVLDITKCYQEAMEKLERMYESSKKLHDALQGVQMEIGIGQQPLQVIKYFENLKSVMNGPTLDTVLDENTLPSYVGVKTSVYDAAMLMKENHTTAVLVKDQNEDITGIFTSKDVVLRVIAAGLDPKTCSVIRVMTSSPDVAPKDLTIQAALRKMFDGHYLNLPIVEDNEIIGIVEVLKLTYATLNQISMMSSQEDDPETEGPAWNKFWTSLDNDTESVASDSQVDMSNISPIPDISQSEINQFSLNNFSTGDNLGPSDSVSVTNENQSATLLNNTVDIKELPFTFKFKSPLKRVHRISCKPNDGIGELRRLVLEKLNTNELREINQEHFAISYIDDEGDVVAITNDQDLLDCVLIYRNSKSEKADLFIHHPDESIDLEEFYQSKTNKRQNTDGQKSEIVPGIANEILFPGVVFLVGASLIALFALNKK